LKNKIKLKGVVLIMNDKYFDYKDIIEDMRKDDIWEALTDNELLELIEDCDWLFDDEDNPLDL
jgi:hypothetical protein